MKEHGGKKEKTPKGQSRRSVRHWDPVEKLRMVKLHFEEGIPVSIIAEETGVHPGNVYEWCRQYREDGEAGLQSKRNSSKEAGNVVIKERITSFKKENPEFGVKKISQFFKRIFFLPASPETVRRTLHREGLMKPPVSPGRIRRSRVFLSVQLRTRCGRATSSRFGCWEPMPT